MEEGIIVCMYYRKLDEDHELHKIYINPLRKNQKALVA